MEELTSLPPSSGHRRRAFGYSFPAVHDLGYRDSGPVEVHVCEPPSWLPDQLRDELKTEFLLRGQVLLRAGRVAELRGVLRTVAVELEPSARWITEYRPSVRLADVKAFSRTPLELSGALSILLDVLEGLESIHALRYPWGEPLLFGDLGGRAVLIDRGGRAVLDPLAGLRRGAGFDPDEGPPSVRFQHCSPARICGDPPARPDEIFAAGSLLGALLLGRPVFWGESDTATLRKIMEADVQRFEWLARDVPRVIVATVVTALARRPEQRFESASAFAKALVAAADRVGIVASSDAVVRWVGAVSDVDDV